MVPVGGLEPPRPKATDFESVVYTNFTIPALSALLLDVIDYTQRYSWRKLFITLSFLFVEIISIYLQSDFHFFFHYRYTAVSFFNLWKIK